MSGDNNKIKFYHKEEIEFAINNNNSTVVILTYYMERCQIKMSNDLSQLPPRIFTRSKSVITFENGSKIHFINKNMNDWEYKLRGIKVDFPEYLKRN